MFHFHVFGEDTGSCVLDQLQFSVIFLFLMQTCKATVPVINSTYDEHMELVFLGPAETLVI